MADPDLSIAQAERAAGPRPPAGAPDLYTGDQAAQVERLVSFGAECLGWDRHNEGSDFVVLADTEVYRFCVIDPGAGGSDAVPTHGQSMPRRPAATAPRGHWFSRQPRWSLPRRAGRLHPRPRVHTDD